MIRLKCHLKSESDLTFGKAIREEKGANEDYDQFEERTWRLKAHTNNGKVTIPGTMFHQSLIETAKFLGKKIRGRGSATYTNHFKAGIVIENCIDLEIALEELEPEWVFVPADGKKGSGSRVYKCFPLIRSWEGDLFVTILDDQITKNIFEEHLKAAGIYIGIGTFRPIKGGYHGRFSVTSLEEIK